MREVVIAGTGISPFTRNPVRVEDVTLDAGLAALDDAGLGFRDVESAYVGYLFMPTMTGVRAMKEFGLTGVPVQHVENASATGAACFREAYLAVAGGHVDVAMAVGFDTMYVAPGSAFRRNTVESAILPAAYFALWAHRRMHDYGTTAETLAAIAAKNWNHARDCEWAQRRSDHEVTAEEVLDSRMIADPHTSMMSAAVGSGAAVSILCSAEYARANLDGGDRHVRVLASALRTETYTAGHLFLGPVIGPPQMTRDMAKEIWESSGLGPEDVDLVQVHDAFPIEELLYYELLGFCADGEGDKLVAEGATTVGGRIPFSTDGGLIARGHPGGPTGLAQIHETVTQLRGEAGPRQVANAQVGLCHIVGGGSAAIAHLLARQSG